MSKAQPVFALIDCNSSGALLTVRSATASEFQGSGTTNYFPVFLVPAWADATSPFKASMHGRKISVLNTLAHGDSHSHARVRIGLWRLQGWQIDMQV